MDENYAMQQELNTLVKIFYKDKAHFRMEQYDGEEDYEEKFDLLMELYTLPPMVYHYKMVKAIFSMENFKKWYDKKIENL